MYSGIYRTVGFFSPPISLVRHSNGPFLIVYRLAILFALLLWALLLLWLPHDQWLCEGIIAFSSDFQMRETVYQPVLKPSALSVTHFATRLTKTHSCGLACEPRLWVMSGHTTPCCCHSSEVNHTLLLQTVSLPGWPAGVFFVGVFLKRLSLVLCA